MYEEAPQLQLTQSLLCNMKICKIFMDTQREINSIDFSADGSQIVICDDTSLHVYDIFLGKKIRTLYNKVREIDLVRFTHHKSAVLCVSKKEPYEIYYWSLHDNEILKKFIGHTDAILTLDISPSSDYFLTCSQDMTLRLWDLSSPNQECEACLDLRTKKTHCVGAFDPQGVAFAVTYSEVFSGASLCRIQLYDLKKYQTKGCFESWKYDCPQLKILKFSPSGKEILGAAQDNYIMIIDAFRGEKVIYNHIQKKCEIIDYQNDNSIIEASFSPDSQYVISGSETGHLYIWTSDKGELVVKLEGHLSRCKSVKFSPNLAMIASAGRNLVLWTPTQQDQTKNQNQIKQLLIE